LRLAAIVNRPTERVREALPTCFTCRARRVPAASVLSSTRTRLTDLNAKVDELTACLKGDAAKVIKILRSAPFNHAYVQTFGDFTNGNLRLNIYKVTVGIVRAITASGDKVIIILGHLEELAKAFIERTPAVSPRLPKLSASPLRVA